MPHPEWTKVQYHSANGGDDYDYDASGGGIKMIPRWLVRWAVGALAIVLFAFAAREVPVLAVLVALVGGLAGLLYLVTRTRGMSPLQPEHEREKNERFLRDIPPPPGW